MSIVVSNIRPLVSYKLYVSMVTQDVYIACTISMRDVHVFERKTHHLRFDMCVHLETHVKHNTSECFAIVG